MTQKNPFNIIIIREKKDGQDKVFPFGKLNRQEQSPIVYMASDNTPIQYSSQNTVHCFGAKELRSKITGDCFI